MYVHHFVVDVIFERAFLEKFPDFQEAVQQEDVRQELDKALKEEVRREQPRVRVVGWIAGLSDRVGRVDDCVAGHNEHVDAHQHPQ